MRLTIKLPFILLAVVSLSAFSFGLPANGVNIPLSQNVIFDDDETPEVTDRVARISFLDGEAKIRRNGSEDWELAALNLPLVEGDEIATDASSRVEIQFDKDTHLRLDGGSFLRLSTLKDEGIAVSLSVGKLSLLTSAFDKARSYFEVDAPKVTLAVQRSGRYFIDAGEKGDSEVRVSIDRDGEARVYSDSAGFTLKNDRTARIYIDGPNAGEWQTSSGVSMSDDFASWLNDREDIVVRRLNDAHYGKYYDPDIYGADDLGDNGDWINTDDYGYVWRPSRLATAQYANWSPYRYGHWRWMPPFGWVWVNDEPWGWATYHHGRWFMHNGGWVWSPYGYYRARRSWWSPALVVINIYNNNVCWYPLSYHRRRYNYNAQFQKRRNHDRVTIRPRDPRLPPETVGKTPPIRSIRDKNPIDDVPVTGIVTTGTNDFGKQKMPVRTAPEAIAKSVLMKRTDGEPDTVLPEYNEKRRVLDVITARPKIDPVVQTRVGIGTRKSDRPLDSELQKTRIFGGREPQKMPETGQQDPVVRSSEPRKTGVIERPPVVVRQPTDPIRVPPPDGSEKVRPTPTRQPSPVFTPPQRDQKPRDTTPVRDTPRYDPPPTRTVEKVRNDPPPVKPAPRNDPPPKSSPKQESRPAPSRKEKPNSL